MECPDKGVDPGHNCQKPHPTHDLDRFGMGMVALDGNPTRQSHQKQEQAHNGGQQQDKCHESQVVVVAKRLPQKSHFLASCRMVVPSSVVGARFVNEFMAC